MSITKTQDIAFVLFRTPDLCEMRVFLEAFGLTCLEEGGRCYGRGADSLPFVHVTEMGEPGFAGLRFRVRSRAKFAPLAERNNVSIGAFDESVGGFRGCLQDSDDNAIDVVAEPAWTFPEMLEPDLAINSAKERRRVHEPIQFARGTSRVYRLGQAVFNGADFAVSESKQRCGLITSDQIEIEPGVPFGAFLRCGRGETLSDDHTLFLMQGPGGFGFHHAAFEVSSLDNLMKGHGFLKSRKWNHSFGVGRLIPGSRIFDY